MRRLIIAAVLFYVLLVLHHFPADVAAHWVLPESVKVYGIEGTIWSGSAEQVDPGAAGIVLGDTRWTINPLSVLTARASGTLSTQLDERSRLNTSFSKPFFGQSLALSDTQGIIDLSAVPAALRPNQVAGRVGLSFDTLRLDAMWPTRAQGSVDLVDLQLSRPSQIDLGSFEIVFDGSGVVGKVADTDSDISVNGELSLAADRSYLFEGSALAGPNANRNIADALQFLGAQDADGRVALSFSGTVD